MEINFNKIINKINKICHKSPKTFFKRKKLLLSLIRNDKLKKKINNLDSSQVKKVIKTTFLPNLDQLYFIYNMITIFKRVTVLEFGVGWSTNIISKALLENKQKYLDEVRNLRFNNPFHLSTLDNYKKYIVQTKKRMEIQQQKITSFYFSNVRTVKFQGRICTEYEILPKINPDFIFMK